MPARTTPNGTDTATTGRRLGELTLDAPVEVSRDATIREAAALMEDAGVSCLLVGASPPWFVTEHDLAGGLAAGMGPDSLVGPLASRAPVWATVTSTVADALSMMVHHRVRHLLVLNADGGPAGILSVLAATKAAMEP